MSNLGGIIQREWDCLAELVLRLDGHLGSLAFRHNWVRVGLNQGFLQLLELCRCKKHVSHLVALPIIVISTFYIPSEGDDSVWAWHLQDQVCIIRNCHELGEPWPPGQCIVCHFEIGYLKQYVLSSDVLLCPKGHEKSDLADGGRCCSGDYSVEGSLTRTQRRSG
jgi:hypothetical protein